MSVYYTDRRRQGLASRGHEELVGRAVEAGTPSGIPVTDRTVEWLRGLPPYQLQRVVESWEGHAGGRRLVSGNGERVAHRQAPREIQIQASSEPLVVTPQGLEREVQYLPLDEGDDGVLLVTPEGLKTRDGRKVGPADDDSRYLPL